MRKESKQYASQSSSSHGLKLATDLINTSSESKEEIEIMANEKTLGELVAPDLNQQPLCITYLSLDVPFELKSSPIHLLPSFHGFPSEDPYNHLKEFHARV